MRPEMTGWQPDDPPPADDRLPWPDAAFVQLVLALACLAVVIKLAGWVFS